MKYQRCGIIAGVLGCILSHVAFAQSHDWKTVGGDAGCMRYSSLKQIDRTNVHRLQLAWTYHTGELVDGKGKTIECTPLIIDGWMYITTAERRVVALDAAQGTVRWEFDPRSYGPLAGPLASGGVNRGVAFWEDPQDRSRQRIFHGTSDGRLYCIDAQTGRLDPGFGTRGAKDLREDLDRDLAKLPYGPTSAPAVVDDVVIVGFSNGEGPDVAAPGDIRAFDARTGKPRWQFRTVPIQENMEMKHGKMKAGNNVVVPMPGVDSAWTLNEAGSSLEPGQPLSISMGAIDKVTISLPTVYWPSMAKRENAFGIFKPCDMTFGIMIFLFTPT